MSEATKADRPLPVLSSEGLGPNAPKPRAWERADGMSAITDDELEARIQAGDGQIVDDYTVPLYDRAALDLVAVLERERLRQLVANDSWACTFQTMGQYRRALMAALGA